MDPPKIPSDIRREHQKRYNRNLKIVQLLGMRLERNEIKGKKSVKLVHGQIVLFDDYSFILDWTSTYRFHQEIEIILNKYLEFLRSATGNKIEID